ncbi:uncharacterized protein LOC108094100 [Drosophila ficusphila]|uniref:uncharacterized protein LOC108094100 n=1 Tax=Drosophila ficusphila TaxID=30025 RepID=UPI001C8A1A8C|nr:uncharacterized protein LOC108094100 [Drosophila ficusphila]
MKSAIIWLLGTVLATTAYETYKLTKEDKISPEIEEIFREIDRLSYFNGNKPIHSAACMIGSDFKYIDTSKPLVREMKEIYDQFGWILHCYDTMRAYMGSPFENETLISFATVQLTDKRSSNLQSMEAIHDKLFGSGNLIAKLATGNQLEVFTCKTDQSPRQFLYTWYVDYVLLELKVHAMVEWSWMILEKFGLRELLQDEVGKRGAYKRRTSGTLPKIKELMSRADRSVWRCDPRKHSSGATYEEVTRLLQGYVENEVDLNEEGSCLQGCSSYKTAKSEGCFENKFCAEQPKCSGGVHDCRSVESDMEICQAPSTSNRRYEYIKYESGRVQGKIGSCRGRLSTAKSWQRWFVKCSYCVCLCDEPSEKSDRYFNLRPVIADVDNNRVVTGLRFVKHNRVFHLQIEEGQLLPLGAIKPSSVQWKQLDSYSVLDDNVTMGIDFHMLSYEKRSIDLDELKVDNNSVVTGLRFKVVGGHLQLQALFSKVDFLSGKLIEPKSASYWISGDNKHQRNKLTLADAAVPTQSSQQSIPHPSDNQFIEFTNSDFYQDAAQSTVPFIDIQEVISEPPVPLSGIGLYFKGRHGYGGFLAPKLITYDFTPYVQLPTLENPRSGD